MLPYAKWTADYLYERICYESYSLFEHRVATPSLIRQLEDLFSPFEALRNMSSSAQYGVEFYEFYFRIPWKRQAKATKKRTKKWEWLCLCFRRDHYRGDVYYAIQIGHSIILDVFDGNGLRGKDGYESMAKTQGSIDISVNGCIMVNGDNEYGFGRIPGEDRNIGVRLVEKKRCPIYDRP